LADINSRILEQEPVESIEREFRGVLLLEDI